MEGFFIHSVDVLSSWRGMNRRLGKHRFMSFWFAILLIAFVWIILEMLELTFLGEGALISLEASTLYLLVFFLFMAKTVAETKSKVVENQSLLYLLSQPVRTRTVMLSKLATLMVFNLGLLAMAFGVGAAELLIFNFQIPTSPWVYLSVIASVVLATTSGYVFQIMNTLRPFKKRLLIFLVLPQITVFYFSLNYMALRPEGQFVIFLALCIYSLGPVTISSSQFLDSWNIGTSAGKAVVRSVYDLPVPGWFSRFSRYLDPKVSALVRREAVEKLRTRDILGTVITVGAVAGGIVYAMGRVSDVELFDGRFDYLVNPLVIGIGIYIASVLEPGISSLTSVGREGKNIWLLKTSPLMGKEVLQSKAIANLWPLFLIVPAVGVYDTVHAGYWGAHVVFAVVTAVAMGLCFTGLGTWFGARYPNFEEAMKGNPDIVTMYIYSMICLVTGSILVGVPFLVYLEDRVMGILAIVLAADVALFVLHRGITAAGSEFDRMEAGF